MSERGHRERVCRLASRWAAPATLATVAVVTVTFAVLAWQRRWISDDGLIVVRTVRQILEGNGPVYSAFERAEPNTSTLWTWVLAAVGGVSGRELAPTAVFTGLVLAVAGLALALAGTRDLHRVRGASAPLLPAGVLVVLAVSPFWDYATSGLETGLCMFWLGASWWLFVAMSPQTTRRRQLSAVIVLGLGPLVRPDLALASMVLLVATWALVRPAWRRTLLLLAAAVALPVAYEIFRAGYYGTLVPLPALAKGAASAEWARGFAYLVDFGAPYLLWLPLIALVAIAILGRRELERRERIVVLAPIIAAVLSCAFVVRVGGDFMHGRMLLPATFLALLPVLLVPVRRFTAPAVVAIAGWAFVTCGKVRPPDADDQVINDERAGYVVYTGRRHPITSAAYLRVAQPVATMVTDAAHSGARLLITEGGSQMPMNPALPGSGVFAVGRLGLGGVIAPLDGIVGDTLGLANPLGARITVTNPGHPGHEKPLPWAWALADYADPAIAPPDGTSPVLVAAARHAMRCGDLAELLASVRDPLTAGRFWDNLVGSFARTRLVVPADPIEAEWKFCGDAAHTPIVTASSSFESPFYSRLYVTDGQPRSVHGGSMGYSSLPGPHAPDHEEWLAVRYPTKRAISKIVLHPRTDDLGVGFPVDFTIQIWDGTRWIDRVTQHGLPQPTTAQTFAWTPADTTDRIRLRVTRLGRVADGYQLQLAEITALP